MQLYLDTSDKHSQAIAVVQMTQNLDGVVNVIDEVTWREDDVDTHVDHLGEEPDLLPSASG